MTESVRTIATGAIADAILSADGTTIYAAQGGTITAYSTATGAVQHSWSIGTKIGGMDISPDGLTLIATERTPGPTITTNGYSTHEISAYSIDLTTSAASTFSAMTDSYFSPFDVAALNNGKALISLDDLGSNPKPLASLDIVAATLTVPNISPSNTYSVRSIFNPAADHAATVFDGYDFGTGAVHTVDNAGTITSSSFDPFGSSSSSALEAVSVSGDLIVSGTALYDLQYHRIDTPTILNQQFDFGRTMAGLALNSDGTDLYVLDSARDLVLEFDTSDWHIVRGFGVGDAVTTTISSISEDGLAYGDRLDISADGRTLSIIGDNKLQVVDLTTAQSTVGTESDDHITGTAGDDVILGFGGNDILDGGAGNDRMTGGAGNDTYYVDSSGDTVNEAENGGTDTVITSVSMFIPYQVEILRAADGVAVTLNGNFGHGDTLIGSTLNDTLYGNGGGDTLIGGLGDDLLDGGLGGGGIAVINSSLAAATVQLVSGGDILVTSPDGNDTLHNIQTIQFNDATFNVSDLYTNGTDGNDLLNGGTNSDAIFGYGGNDTIHGGDGDDLLAGGAGDDLLDGGAGTDTARIAASIGSATVSVSDTGDLIIRSAEGTDTLHSIERIEANDFEGPSANFANIGTAGADDLADALWEFGLDGNDTLRSGQYLQHLVGGNGDDTYILGALVYNNITEASDGGFDTVILNFKPDSSAGYHIPANVEKMVLGVSSGARLYGDAGNNVLVGNAGSDVLSGGPGDDILTGGGGSDSLVGGDGHDIFQDTAAGLNGDGINDLAIGEIIHITDATLADFSFSLSAPLPTFPGSSTTYTMLTYTGGSLGLTNLPANGALQLSTDIGGGVDLTLVPTQAHHAIQNDFDGDGKSDILWRSASGQFGDWLATGSGNVAPNAQLYGVSTDWKVAGTGDFNGDGKTDVLWRNDNGQFGDWLASGNGNFTPNAQLYGVTNDWHIAGTGDFNGDGKTDLLWRNDNGTFGTWSADAGGASFTPNSTLYGVTNDWKIAGTGDFDGDGKTDILWRNTNTGQFGDWLSNGNGAFTPNATLGNSPLNWHIAETGDFNGDGKTDILWRADDGQLGTWFAGAGGSFTPNATLYGVTTDWKIVDVGDYNGDGKDDILWRNSSTGQVGDWIANGNGSFTPNATLYTAPLDWSVAGDHAFLV